MSVTWRERIAKARDEAYEVHRKRWVEGHTACELDLCPILEQLKQGRFEDCAESNCDCGFDDSWMGMPEFNNRQDTDE